MVFIDEKAIAINALIEAVEAIEVELGITPSGVYSDIRVRLDILEARINNPFAPAPNVENPFIIGNDGVTISTGTGYPTENRLPGSLYLRKDGYNNEGLYARRPDMMWHQIDTDPWTANRDLAGTIYSQTVIGLQDHDINPDASLLQTDAAGDGYVLTWNDTANAGNGWWEPQIGFYAFGDLDGTKINQTLVNIQGTPILIGAMGATQDGYTLVWNNTIPQWEPQRLAVVFDPLDNSTTTNIRSNRYSTQSPVDGTKSGIVNLGSDTTQLTLGVNANFGTVLGGDQNVVTGDYGAVVGGFGNVVSSDNSFIGGGSNNTITITGLGSFIGGGIGHTASGEGSFIGGGNTNTVDGYFSSVVGGFSNDVVGTSSSILGGQSNDVVGDYSSILSGSSNYLAAQHSVILGGITNISIGNYSLVFGSSNIISGSVNSGFTSILGGASNSLIANDPVSYLTIIGGTLNILRGTRNTIVNGASNTVTTATSYSTILGGNNNSIDGYYNAILAGNNNSIINAIHSIVSGDTNSLSSSYSLVVGLTNIVAAGTNNFVTIFGDNNIINAGSHYTGAWGCSNITNDGYIAVFGDHNTMNTGSTYADVHGDHNLIGNAPYTSIWGDHNTINNTANYSAIFGNLNVIGSASSYSCIYGGQNNIGANSSYSYVNGLLNNIGVSSTYSSAWGLAHNVTGNYANVWGSYNSTSADWTTVFGYYGKAVYPGQFSISSRSISGTTAGASQYAKIILDGTQVAGGQFDLIPFGGSNLVLENGKSYDMTIRILINNTSGSPTCARHVLDVLAHCEAGTLTLDVVNVTIANDNGTGWTVSLLTSGNQLIVRVNSSGTLNRRAIATVDWRELSRT